MSAGGMYSLRELEEHSDKTKAAILQALMREGLLEDEVAEKWCETHTIILRKKGIFRTITDKFFKVEEEENVYNFIIVKSVDND